MIRSTRVSSAADVAGDQTASVILIVNMNGSGTMPTWKTDRAKEYHKERYRWLKEHGICVCCGSNDAEPNRVLCFHCLEKNNAKKKADWYVNHEKKLEYQRNYYRELKEKGVCVRCRKRTTDNGRSCCSVCLGQFRARDAKKRREEGRLPMDMRGDGYHCAICTRDVAKAGDKLCEQCMERCRAKIALARQKIDHKNHKWREK